METSQQKLLLILDLDETLIFSTKNKISKQEDSTIDEYFVYKRPGLDLFLNTILIDFEIAVWTSSTEDYAEEVINKIFPKDYPLSFVYGRTKCTPTFMCEQNNYTYSKNLKKLKSKNYNLEKILIIDDSPEKLRRNYGNHIRVTPFVGSNDDIELFQLIKYLKKIKLCDNVRAIEKRFWRVDIK